MAFTDDIAEAVLGTRFQDLSPEVLHWARTSILDTFAVTFAGAREPAVDRLKSVVVSSAKPGPCTVIGATDLLQPMDAALVNGMSAHVLDFDTSNDTFEGHPSVHLLPALFALAEAQGAHGRELLHAYVVGFEAQATLARAIQPVAVNKGWFPSSSIGMFGVAAGAALLLGLDARRTSQAIGMCAMFASGTLAHAGSMTKPLGAGHAARCGLFAALLAAKDFTAADEAIEGRRGYFELFGPIEAAAARDALDRWGQPFDVIETSIGIKRYPCCGIIHSTLDVVAGLLDAHDVAAAAVAEVEVKLVTQRLHHVNRPDPQTPIEGKFSVQYCVARMLTDRRIGIESFTSDAVQDGGLRQLMAKIRVSDHDQIRPKRRRDEGGTEVTMMLADGRQLSGRANKALGRIVGQPLPDDMVDAKFLDCAAPTTGLSRAQALLAILRDLGAAGPVFDLGRLMRSPAGPDGR